MSSESGKEKLPFRGKPYKEVLQIAKDNTEIINGIPAVRNFGVGIRTSGDYQQYVIKAFVKTDIDGEQIQHFPREIDGVAIDYEVQRNIPSAKPAYPDKE
jgi:hypothetical protein